MRGRAGRACAVRVHRVCAAARCGVPLARLVAADRNAYFWTPVASLFNNSRFALDSRATDRYSPNRRTNGRAEHRNLSKETDHESLPVTSTRDHPNLRTECDRTTNGYRTWFYQQGRTRPA